MLGLSQSLLSQLILKLHMKISSSLLILSTIKYPEAEPSPCLMDNWYGVLNTFPILTLIYIHNMQRIEKILELKPPVSKELCLQTSIQIVDGDYMFKHQLTKDPYYRFLKCVYNWMNCTLCTSMSILKPPNNWQGVFTPPSGDCGRHLWMMSSSAVIGGEQVTWPRCSPLIGPAEGRRVGLVTSDYRPLCQLG